MDYFSISKEVLVFDFYFRWMKEFLEYSSHSLMGSKSVKHLFFIAHCGVIMCVMTVEITLEWCGLYMVERGRSFANLRIVTWHWCMTVIRVIDCATQFRMCRVSKEWMALQQTLIHVFFIKEYILMQLTDVTMPASDSFVSPITWDDATWILSCSFMIFTMQTGKRIIEITRNTYMLNSSIRALSKIVNRHGLS